jgi:Saccharopine dehydrogenase NADP binding domain
VISLDVSSITDLDNQVAIHDLVISLIPFIHHAAVIKSVIKSKTQVVTTSYASPAIRELEAAVKEASIKVLNEVALTLVWIIYTPSNRLRKYMRKVGNPRVLFILRRSSGS